MVKLIPLLFGLIFIIMILWAVWKAVLATCPPLRRVVESMFGDEVDETEDRVNYEISKRERRHAAAEKVKTFKKKKIKENNDKETIKSFVS